MWCLKYIRSGHETGEVTEHRVLAKCLFCLESHRVSGSKIIPAFFLVTKHPVVEKVLGLLLGYGSKKLHSMHQLVDFGVF